MASHFFLRYQFLSFGTLYPQPRSFSFRVEVLHWKGDIIRCAPRSCTGKDFTWDVAFAPFSNIFTALAVLHSFLALQERRIQALTKTYIWRDEANEHFPFLLQRNGITRPRRQGGKLASFGLWLQSQVSRSSSALTNHKWNTVHAQAFTS